MTYEEFTLGQLEAGVRELGFAEEGVGYTTSGGRVDDILRPQSGGNAGGQRRSAPTASGPLRAQSGSALTGK